MPGVIGVVTEDGTDVYVTVKSIMPRNPAAVAAAYAELQREEYAEQERRALAANARYREAERVKRERVAANKALTRNAECAIACVLRQDPRAPQIKDAFREDIASLDDAAKARLWAYWRPKAYAGHKALWQSMRPEDFGEDGAPAFLSPEDGQGAP